MDVRLNRGLQCSAMVVIEGVVQEEDVFPPDSQRSKTADELAEGEWSQRAADDSPQVIGAQVERDRGCLFQRKGFEAHGAAALADTASFRTHAFNHRVGFPKG